MAVGTGAELQTGALSNGIWTAFDLTYSEPSSNMWTGSTAIDALGTAASTCNDWGATTSTAGRMGRASSVLSDFFNAGTQTCAAAKRVYCAEP